LIRPAGVVCAGRWAEVSRGGCCDCACGCGEMCAFKSATTEDTNTSREHRDELITCFPRPLWSGLSTSKIILHQDQADPLALFGLPYSFHARTKSAQNGVAFVREDPAENDTAARASQAGQR